MTVRRHIAYWVAMSPARRVVASLGVAAIIGGTTFGACRASDIAGPNFKQKQAPGVSRTLGTSDGLIGDSDHDSDSDNWPSAPSRHKKVSDDEANNDEKFRSTTETVAPWTEMLYNTCRNEGPIVLNGYVKTRTRLDTEPLGSISFKLMQWKDTRGVYGTYTYEEDYWDDYDHSWKKRQRTIRYHNRETLLDMFDAGPMGLPFRSEFHSRMYLQREGADPYNHKYGDDLFVYVKQTVKIGKDGLPRMHDEFRTECK